MSIRKITCCVAAASLASQPAIPRLSRALVPPGLHVRALPQLALFIRAVLTPVLLAPVLLALAIPAGTCLAMTAGEEVIAYEDGTAYRVVYRVTVPAHALVFGKHMGYDTVSLEGAGHLKDAGCPALPCWTSYIAIPPGMRVTGLREVHDATVTVPGRFNILPAQLPRAITGDLFVPEEAGPDPAVYSSAALYPASRIEFVRQADLAGQNLAAIRVCPLQYSPETAELVLSTRIDIAIEGEPGRTCGDYMPGNATERSRALHRRMLKGMVVNPQDIGIAERFSGPVLGGVGAGQHDYVIVTQEAWADDFAPLAEWRTKQGWKVNTVTTEWIFTGGGYAGTDTEKMRAFIADAHSTWGTTHFVLAADTHIIPYHTRAVTVPGWQTDNIDNDTYYADYDDDWVLEVAVARLSVRTVGQIPIVINKILTYEKSPPLTGYARTAFFIGMDITECGDMDGEIFKEDYIRAGHLPVTWTLDTEYDGEPGTHKDDIIAYLEAGHHLVNHHDHCDAGCMGAGWICHSDLFYNADMDALTNGDRLSIFFAVGCFPAHFPTLKCIGEAAIRNALGGGIAFMGNTSYGWGGDAADPDLYSVRQDRYFYRNLFDLGIYNLGENFTRLKNDEYDPVDPYNLHEYAFTQLHLLGDPGLTIWTDDPQSLAVVHPADAVAGEPTMFDVEVSGAGGPIDGASVCLWKDGDIHEVEETVGGEAGFEFTMTSAGTLFVTVCCHNYIPYEGICTVGPAASAEGEVPGAPGCFEIVSAVPTPFKRRTSIAYAVPESGAASLVTVDIYDCLGRRIRRLQAETQEAGTHHITWDGRDGKGSEAASGVYYCEVRWRDKRDTRRLVLLR